MILFRFACLMAGMLVLVAPPAMLFPNGAAFTDMARPAGLLVVLLLAASSFFFIAVSAHRFKRDPALARKCALLLGLPFLAGAATLWRGVDPTVLWMGAALLIFTLIVALAIMLPMLRGPSAARLRAREARHARPPVLHHF